MTFGELLKSHRQRLGFTQSEAAAVLEIPARTHWEWESGKTTPHAITQEGALARLSLAMIEPKDYRPVAEACGLVLFPE